MTEEGSWGRGLGTFSSKVLSETETPGPHPGGEGREGGSMLLLTADGEGRASGLVVGLLMMWSPGGTISTGPAPRGSLRWTPFQPRDPRVPTL